MHFLLLLLTSLLLTGQKITQKRYNAVCKSGAFLFGSMISFCAMAVFAALNRDWTRHPSFILPALGFGLSYAAATVFTVLAIRHGSLARTTLVTSYSLLVPAAAGLIILREPLKPSMMAGIILLVISLWLTHHRKASKGEGKTVTPKWLVFVTLSFAGNGLCSTVQKLAPRYIGDSLNQNLYMTAALGLSGVVLVTASFLAKESDRPETLRRGTPLAVICGLCNAGVNFLVLYLNQHLPASVMFPAISAGQIILVCAYSLLFSHETFTPKQWAGFAVGICSVVLLNL